jgi:O-acetylhomoserine (thiol)-lyase
MSYEAWKDESLGFTTKQLHAGYNPQEHGLSKAVPVYQTAAFQVGGFDRCLRLSADEEEGYSYARFGNPTNTVLEKRMASLEGGSAALSMSSGVAAAANLFLNLSNSGGEIAAVKTLYGGNSKLLAKILPQYGIIGKFVEDENDIASFEKQINEKTRAVFIESLGNPAMNIIDMEKLSALAHSHGIPLIVDNTFATPYLLRPFEYGADIVCYSATKYLGGHGTTIGGVVVEKGGFNWLNGKFPQIEQFYNDNKNIPDDEFKQTVFTRRLRGVYLTSFGAHMTPTAAFSILQGIETLSLRMERHVQNAQKLAEYLGAHRQVKEVSYPGLENSPYNELAKKYFPKGPGAIFTIRLHGGLEAAKRVLENVRVFDYIINVGDAKSLIVHPATSTHYWLKPSDREAAGVYDDSLRLSVGIEDIEDLINDMKQALSNI